VVVKAVEDGIPGGIAVTKKLDVGFGHLELFDEETSHRSSIVHATTQTPEFSLDLILVNRYYESEEADCRASKHEW
jgi:hypothetical protein